MPLFTDPIAHSYERWLGMGQGCVAASVGRLVGAEIFSAAERTIRVSLKTRDPRGSRTGRSACKVGTSLTFNSPGLCAVFFSSLRGWIAFLLLSLGHVATVGKTTNPKRLLLINF